MMTYTPTQAERDELRDIQQYLAEHSKTDFRHMPEKTIAAVFNNASPAVREHMAKNREFVTYFRETGGRDLPFAPKRDINDLPISDEIRKVMDRTDTEEVTHGLLSRMGTDTGQDNAPPDRREYLEAAFDHHEGSTND